MTSHPLPILLERFFTDRLANQLDATANTMDSYPDFRNSGVAKMLTH